MLNCGSMGPYGIAQNMVPVSWQIRKLINQFTRCVCVFFLFSKHKTIAKLRKNKRGKSKAKQKKTKKLTIDLFDSYNANGTEIVNYLKNNYASSMGGNSGSGAILMVGWPVATNDWQTSKNIMAIEMDRGNTVARYPEDNPDLPVNGKTHFYFCLFVCVVLFLLCAFFFLQKNVNKNMF